MESNFHSVDLLFAKKIYPEGDAKQTHLLSELLQSAREGHLCLPLDEKDETLLPPHLFERLLVKEAGRLYLRRNWECEKQFESHLKRLQRAIPPLSVAAVEAMLEQASLNKEQKHAILKAAQQPLTLICGGPGTGKTYTAAQLIKIFHTLGLKKVIVAAPTGKAAANIRTALKETEELCTISTLHALLQEERIFADLVVIDETSMVAAEEMAKLFSAIREGTRLILIGDAAQLPPIESGHFFSDMADNKELVAELGTCLRSELQEIIDLAVSVKKGQMIPYLPLPKLDELMGLIFEKNFSVLTPFRKGLYGVDHLNARCKEEEEKRGVRRFPIMITVNDAHLNLYNGDTGILDQLQEKAYFSKGRVFSEYILPPFEYAFVLSVHKSQGSEYERVLIVLPKGSEVFGREMLYTAITRAKKELLLFAEEGVIEQLITSKLRRRSGLNEKTLHFDRS